MVAVGAKNQICRKTQTADASMTLASGFLFSLQLI